ncbi:MAG: PKD domain-containing protein, partial [Patescibacteria group bacterium]|nr:PKD domain-containing protein [Patescibacteria group bacterium]
RFPLPNPDVTYGYAVVASWLDVDIHPANTPEVVATNISTTASNINFNTSDYCGNLVADISLAGFGKQPSTIFIDAEDLFSTSQSFDPSVIVVGGGDNYSTYHIDIPVDNVTSAGEKDFWVIAEYNDEDYSNEYGVPNNANGPLAAYFVGSVVIGTESCNEDPICDVQVITSMPIDGWDAGVPVEFDASGSYDPNDDPLSFEWDFDNDGVFGDSYDSGTDDNPTKIFTTSTQEQVCVKVADGKGGENSCCVDVDISVYQSKNIPLRSGVEARDITVVGSTGDLLILYSDGQVWEYPEPYTFGSTFSGTMFYDTGLTYLQYIEASSNGDSLVNSGTSGPPFASRSYYNNGANYSNHTSSSNYTWNSDGWCPTYVEENPTWDNRHCTWYNYSPPPLTRAICHGWDPDPPYQYLGGDGYFPPGVEGLGPDYIRHEYLVGTEVDSNGYVYCLENGPGTDRSVERRTYRLGSQNGPYWGGWGDDSGFGDTSPKFNDPKDITRDDDSTNTIYVLDELSTGDPAIKKFTWEGTPEGTFGDTTTISSTPLRIEGSQRTFPETNENLMFVLHGNATDGYFISIFTPTELTT